MVYSDMAFLFYILHKCNDLKYFNKYTCYLYFATLCNKKMYKKKITADFRFFMRFMKIAIPLASKNIRILTHDVLFILFDIQF
jgi:hypothetical protein